MAIEGPLRELGIHDVFQLLDLSRKTGRLRVTSALRDNEGVVTFVRGRVVSASMRSNPWPIGQLLLSAGRITESDLERARSLQRLPGEQRRIGELLVATGALTSRELERQIRRQVETVVFELMSWQEGFFSFSEEEGQGHVPADAGLSAESLLMEGARRIDEWARIAICIPDVSVVPSLAPVGAHPSRLELLPNEWEVLAAVDGAADVRTIAVALGRADFDVARILYGLVTTGVVAIHPALREHATENATGMLALADTNPNEPEPTGHELADLMRVAGACIRSGDLDGAVACWERVVATAPSTPEANAAREAMAHAARLAHLVGVT